MSGAPFPNERGEGDRLPSHYGMHSSPVEMTSGTTTKPRFDTVVVRTPHRLKQRLYFGLQRALYFSGAASAYVRTMTDGGAMILMYHSVAAAPEADWIDPGVHIPAAIFEEQMQYLAERRHVIPLSELVQALEDHAAIPRETVVITFDDGYLDNYTVAAPILARHNLPATLFLATAPLADGAPQWVDRLYGAFRGRTENTLSVNAEDGNHPFDLANSVERTRAYRMLNKMLITADTEKREEILGGIEEQLRPERPELRLTMTWDDVIAIRKEYPNIEIGAHTRNHLDLTAHPLDKVRDDIVSGRRDIEEKLGAAPAHFACPYNRSNETVRRLTHEAGFRCAMSADGAALIGKNHEPFHLMRTEAPVCLNRFRYITSGAHPGLTRLLVGRP